MQKIIIGVMGPGEGATAQDITNAYQLGQLIATQDWVLLTGGRDVGVMDAACRGAKSANGLTIGILPSYHSQRVSSAVDLPILTDMGNARNNINILTSQVVIACGMGAGTASEIALALKVGKPVILLNASPVSHAFFQELSPTQVFSVPTPIAAIQCVQKLLVSEKI
jgi:uncharacterized protein (TIGR00725 family)